MIYYTIRSVPRTLTRFATYRVQHGKQTVFQATFKETVTPKTLGSFIRFDAYTVSPSARYGLYVFRATLKIDGKSQTRSWRFAVLKRIVVTTLDRYLSVEQPADQSRPHRNAGRRPPIGIVARAGPRIIPRGRIRTV
jgi:hypothetical protein